MRTDQELAEFMGSAQSTVSNWRKRGAVPESAVLKFEAVAADPNRDELRRLVAAQTVALRLPELYYERWRERDPKMGRHIFYSGISLSLGAIIAEVAEQMKRLETAHKLSIESLVPLLLEDVGFLNGVLDWLEETSFAEIVGRSKAYGDRRRSLDQ